MGAETVSMANLDVVRGGRSYKGHRSSTEICTMGRSVAVAWITRHGNAGAAPNALCQRAQPDIQSCSNRTITGAVRMEISKASGPGVTAWLLDRLQSWGIGQLTDVQV